MQRPLADEIRPKTLDEVVGQRHLLAPGAVLRRLIEGGTEANMVFYGPSGTGKTTIANIVAERTHKALYRLNATTASLQDIKDIIADVGTLMAPGGVLLYGIPEFRLPKEGRCRGCGHELMLPRSKAEKSIRKVLAKEEPT